ncbi:Tripartite tricarboxylate transporter substrate binding protein [Bordetella tumbae]|uniref:Bug family tripartite tricarboxylate transporter substrate binding protein n=1 Tax=Bordetella tumbae TaxID=1649139 RepID=UPI0039F0CE05
MQAKRRTLLAAMASLPLAARAAPSHGWQPRRPVDMLISYPVGGGADNIGRALASQITTQQKGWEIIPMNKPGGGGLIFLRALSEAQPNGGTIGICLSSQLTFPPDGARTQAFELANYTLLGAVATSYLTIIVKSKGPITSIDTFRAFAKKKGAVSIAVSPTFSWISNALSDSLGVPVIGVVYKGAGEYLPALVGGHVDLVLWAGGTQQLEAAGTIDVIATVAPQRMPGAPSVSTLKESGIPVEVESHFIMLAPKGMDTNIADVLIDVVAEAAQNAVFQNRMEALLGRPARYIPPNELAPLIEAQQKVAVEYESQYRER